MSLLVLAIRLLRLPRFALPRHLVEDLIDGFPAEYRVGHVSVGFYVEYGLAQKVAFDVGIICTVPRHDAAKLFFKTRPTAFLECTEDSRIVFPDGVSTLVEG